jgi:hypothetical protein
MVRSTLARGSISVWATCGVTQHSSEPVTTRSLLLACTCPELALRLLIGKAETT